jgi:hypothetical protein
MHYVKCILKVPIFKYKYDLLIRYININWASKLAASDWYLNNLEM